MTDINKHGSWDFGDLDGYIREGEPGQAERAENWQVAIGLQAVDGLKTSGYLLETAKEHIEGRIGIDEAQRRIRSYYEERGGREENEASEEADMVSGRIAELLGERAFTLSPVELCDIHRRLFDQVLPHAGKYRNYNITKKEWILKGDTVYYANLDWQQHPAGEQADAATQETTATTQETTQEKLLMLLRKNPSLTARQLSRELGISFDGVRYHLAKLRKAGVIHHEGPTKSGRWVIDEQG